MKFKGYDISAKYLLDDAIKWETTGSGQFIIGTKGGRTYFIKRNAHIRYPSSDINPKIYEKMYKKASDLENKQKEIARLMRGLSWDRDHVVVEEEHFWDEQRFITITALVPNVVDSTESIAHISQEDFVALAVKTIKLLETIHSRGVTHGDIKPANIALSLDCGELVPYLIDFDSSFPTGKAPERPDLDDDDAEPGVPLFGTVGYFSPEILEYYAEDSDAPLSILTPATDIFSIAVVLHRWWTDNSPAYEKSTKTFSINSKFNFKLGVNHGATLMSLLNWMLAMDYKERPTATQVINVLQDKESVPDKFHVGSDVKPFDATLWPTHAISIVLLSADELKAKGLKSFKKVDVGPGDVNKKYSVIGADGIEKICSIEELCSLGYAKRKDASIVEPWDGHFIEFASPAVISEKGYIKIGRATTPGRKLYCVTTASGLTFTQNEEWLLRQGLATPKVVAIDSDTPWPEHGTEYDAIAMTRMGVIKISRVEFNGEHRYNITYDEIVDGAPKVIRNVSHKNVKLMGYIK